MPRLVDSLLNRPSQTYSDSGAPARRRPSSVAGSSDRGSIASYAYPASAAGSAYGGGGRSRSGARPVRFAAPEPSILTGSMFSADGPLSRGGAPQRTTPNQLNNGFYYTPASSAPTAARSTSSAAHARARNGHYASSQARADDLDEVRSQGSVGTNRSSRSLGAWITPGRSPRYSYASALEQSVAPPVPPIPAGLQSPPSGRPQSTLSAQPHPIPRGYSPAPTTRSATAVGRNYAPSHHSQADYASAHGAPASTYAPSVLSRASSQSSRYHVPSVAPTPGFRTPRMQSPEPAYLSPQPTGYSQWDVPCRVASPTNPNGRARDWRTFMASVSGTDIARTWERPQDSNVVAPPPPAPVGNSARAWGGEPEVPPAAPDKFTRGSTANGIARKQDHIDRLRAELAHEDEIKRQARLHPGAVPKPESHPQAVHQAANEVVGAWQPPHVPAPAPAPPKTQVASPRVAPQQSALTAPPVQAAAPVSAPAHQNEQEEDLSDSDSDSDSEVIAPQRSYINDPRASAAAVAAEVKNSACPSAQSSDSESESEADPQHVVAQAQEEQEDSASDEGGEEDEEDSSSDEQEEPNESAEQEASSDEDLHEVYAHTNEAQHPDWAHVPRGMMLERVAEESEDGSLPPSRPASIMVQGFRATRMDPDWTHAMQVAPSTSTVGTLTTAPESSRTPAPPPEQGNEGAAEVGSQEMVAHPSGSTQGTMGTAPDDHTRANLDDGHLRAPGESQALAPAVSSASTPGTTSTVPEPHEEASDSKCAPQAVAAQHESHVMAPGLSTGTSASVGTMGTAPDDVVRESTEQERAVTKSVASHDMVPSTTASTTGTTDTAPVPQKENSMAASLATSTSSTTGTALEPVTRQSTESQRSQHTQVSNPDPNYRLSDVSLGTSFGVSGSNIPASSTQTSPAIATNDLPTVAETDATDAPDATPRASKVRPGTDPAAAKSPTSPNAHRDRSGPSFRGFLGFVGWKSPRSKERALSTSDASGVEPESTFESRTAEAEGNEGIHRSETVFLEAKQDPLQRSETVFLDPLETAAASEPVQPVSETTGSSYELDPDVRATWLGASQSAEAQVAEQETQRKHEDDTTLTPSASTALPASPSVMSRGRYQNSPSLAKSTPPETASSAARPALDAENSLSCSPSTVKTATSAAPAEQRAPTTQPTTLPTSPIPSTDAPAPSETAPPRQRSSKSLADSLGLSLGKLRLGPPRSSRNLSDLQDAGAVDVPPQSPTKGTVQGKDRGNPLYPVLGSPGMSVKVPASPSSPTRRSVSPSPQIVDAKPLNSAALGTEPTTSLTPKEAEPTVAPATESDRAPTVEQNAVVEATSQPPVEIGPTLKLQLEEPVSPRVDGKPTSTYATPNLISTPTMGPTSTLLAPSGTNGEATRSTSSVGYYDPPASPQPMDKGNSEFYDAPSTAAASTTSLPVDDAPVALAQTPNEQQAPNMVGVPTIPVAPAVSPPVQSTQSAEQSARGTTEPRHSPSPAAAPASAMPIAVVDAAAVATATEPKAKGPQVQPTPAPAPIPVSAPKAVLASKSKANSAAPTSALAAPAAPTPVSAPTAPTPASVAVSTSVTAPATAPAAAPAPAATPATTAPYLAGMASTAWDDQIPSPALAAALPISPNAPAPQVSATPSLSVGPTLVDSKRPASPTRPPRQRPVSPVPSARAEVASGPQTPLTPLAPNNFLSLPDEQTTPMTTPATSAPSSTQSDAANGHKKATATTTTPLVSKLTESKSLRRSLKGSKKNKKAKDSGAANEDTGEATTIVLPGGITATRLAKSDEKSKRKSSGKNALFQPMNKKTLGSSSSNGKHSPNDKNSPQSMINQLPDDHLRAPAPKGVPPTRSAQTLPSSSSATDSTNGAAQGLSSNASISGTSATSDSRYPVNTASSVRSDKKLASESALSDAGSYRARAKAGRVGVGQPMDSIDEWQSSLPSPSEGIRSQAPPLIRPAFMNSSVASPSASSIETPTEPTPEWVKSAPLGAPTSALLSANNLQSLGSLGSPTGSRVPSIASSNGVPPKRMSLTQQNLAAVPGYARSRTGPPSIMSSPAAPVGAGQRRMANVERPRRMSSNEVALRSKTTMTTVAITSAFQPIQHTSSVWRFRKSRSNEGNSPHLEEPPQPLIGLTAHQAPPRKVGRSEVLVAVIAVAIDAVDRGIVRDRALTPDGYGFVPGRSFCGRIAEVGWSVDSLRKGDIVFGLTDSKRSGALSEYLAIDHTLVAKAPEESLTTEQIAALPATGALAYQVQQHYCQQLDRGSRVLILNAHDGVGLLTMQACTRLGLIIVAQCPPFATDGYAIAQANGAHEVIVGEPLWAINSLHESSFDLVVDTIGGRKLYDASRRILARHGHFVTCYGDEGRSGQPGMKNHLHSLRRTFFKKDRKHIEYEWIGVDLGADTHDALQSMRRAALDGTICPRLNSIFSLEDAHRAFDSPAATSDAAATAVVRMTS